MKIKLLEDVVLSGVRHDKDKTISVEPDVAETLITAKLAEEHSTRTRKADD